MLSIEVTTKCNLRCKNCFAHEKEEFDRDISLKKAKDILLEGRSLGFSKLGITGGEPFLWKGIFKLLTYAKSIGFTSFLINTNGHLLNDELCVKLLSFGISLELSCTINGSKFEHDSIRGIGTYKNAINGVETALKHGLNIYIYSVVNKNNLNEIPHFANFIFKKFPNIKSLIFIQQRGIENNYYDNTIKLHPKEFIEMVKMISYLSLAGYNVHILENSLATVVAKELKLKWFPRSPEISRPGKIAILKDGSITLNHSSNDIFDNYNKGILSKVYKSNKYKKLTEEVSKRCNTCEFDSKCRSGGKLRPSSRYHNIGSNDKYFCQKVMELLK